MRTTFDLPDQLLRQTRSAAALRGQSMNEFARRALEASCRASGDQQRESGWRAVAGKARDADVAGVDAVVSAAFSKVDLDRWR